MRFILMHRTTAKWEQGIAPDPEEIGRVGALMGELVRAGALLGGEGLRASALGVRLSFTGGKRRVTRGPFTPADGVPTGFLILQTTTIDEAIEWTTRLGQILGELRVELRPITETWDLGMGAKPPEVTTTRFMALLKDPAAEAGTPLDPEREVAREKLMEVMAREGVLHGTVMMRPSSEGARLRRDGERFTVIDGPFAESKELVAGYALLELPSREVALEQGRRFAEVVGSPEVDLRLLA